MPSRLAFYTPTPTPAQALVLGTLTYWPSHLRIDATGKGWVHRKDCTFAYPVGRRTVDLLLRRHWLEPDFAAQHAAGTGEKHLRISTAGAAAAVHPGTGRFTFLQQNGSVVITRRRARDLEDR